MDVLDAPRISPQTVAEHGLSPEEYDRILKALGREPNLVELGIFSVMWSEHCSYKSSRVHLKKLPTQAPWVIQGPGENAGVIDIGDGDAAIFKMESQDRKSTRLNSSHANISYAVFCLKKKKTNNYDSH